MLDVKKLKGIDQIPSIATQLTEVPQPKLSPEHAKMMGIKLNRILDDFKTMKIQNFGKLENRILAV